MGWFEFRYCKSIEGIRAHVELHLKKKHQSWLRIEIRWEILKSTCTEDASMSLLLQIVVQSISHIRGVNQK
jgi:hypothetical protein